MNSRPTQCERVRDYIEAHGSITQREAMNELGVYRLASRISEMKKRGVPIQGEFVTELNRWGEKVSFKRYSLCER